MVAAVMLSTSPRMLDATGEVFGDAPNIAARVQGANIDAANAEKAKIDKYR